MTSETFLELLAPNLPAVRRFVQRRVRISDQADDVVQQTLLNAFARRDQLRVRDRFKSWLWSIAMNEVRMLHRTAGRSVSLSEFDGFDVVGREPSPLAKCEQAEAADRLRAGMSRLTERDRTAIRLVDLNGLTAAEAAGTLAVSRAAFKSTHFRARKRLEHALRRAA